MDEARKQYLLSLDEAEFEAEIGFTEAAWLDIKSDLLKREQKMKAQVGQHALPFFAHRLKRGVVGPRVSLQDYLGKPAGLILGSYTCPIFRRHNPRINQIYHELKDKVNFLCVYVYEMHPVDGWMLPVNVKDNVIFEQPGQLQDRAKIAQCWKEAQGVEMDVLLDDMDNSIDKIYAGSPERLYTIDHQGLIRHRSSVGPFEDEEVEVWFESLKKLC